MTLVDLGVMGGCDARTQGAAIEELLPRLRTRQRARTARPGGTAFILGRPPSVPSDGGPSLCGVFDHDYLRRGAAEFVGTFALIFIGAGSIAFARTLTDVALAHGLVIAVFVSAVGFISGGHFNPAVTLGFLVTRRINPILAVFYWVVQFGAAVLAALLLAWVLPSALQQQSNLGAPSLGAGIGAGVGVVVEAVLTFFLVFVVFATAVDPRGTFQQIAGLAIGFTIALDILMGGVLTGAAMNPARAFGPQLVDDHWSNWWVWYVGPLAGGVIAASVYELLYLRPTRPAPVGPPETGVEEPRPGDAATS
jgi:aquaporin TIP